LLFAIVAQGKSLYSGSMELLVAAIIFAALVLLDLLSMRFGVNTRDGRRETWW
jgi:hypothetical protein